MTTEIRAAGADAPHRGLAADDLTLAPQGTAPAGGPAPENPFLVDLDYTSEEFLAVKRLTDENVRLRQMVDELDSGIRELIQLNRESAESFRDFGSEAKAVAAEYAVKVLLALRELVWPVEVSS